MREKLQTLPLAELKEIAKSQGMKGLSGMKKSDIIDLLCQYAEETEEPKETKATMTRVEHSAPRPEFRLYLKFSLNFQISRLRIWWNWTVVLRLMVFWKLCQTVLGLFAVRTFFPEKTTFMWRRPRFAGLI